MDFNLYNIDAKGLFKKSYDVYHHDKLIYTCKLGGFLSKITMHPLDGSTPIRIIKKLTFFKLIIEIYKGEKLLAVLQQGPKIIGYHINVQTSNELLTIEGKVMTSEFTIKRGIEEICKITRKSFRKPLIAMAIQSDEDQTLLLSIILALELIVKVKQASG